MAMGFAAKEKKLLRDAVVSPIFISAPWRSETIARVLNPQRLAALLQQSVERYSSEFLTLAEEMEEKDPHYAGVLGVRKRAVSRLHAVVEPPRKNENAAHVDLVRAVVESADFESMVFDLTDALGKGYSVVEMLWETDSQRWMPRAFAWRDPRWFCFDERTQRELMLYDETTGRGVPLPPYKCIVHIPRIKNGVPIRGGIARLVATSYMCKQFVLSDWMSFLDMYGLPIRVGKYDANATEEDIATLKKAVAHIGVDGAAALPRSMDIVFEKLSDGRGSANQFKEAAQWIDQQVSKAVLGQTMTTDDGSSRAQATVHNDVRLDILEADANELQNTINTQLVKPLIDVNFGVQTAYPKVVIRVPREENITLMVDALEKLVPLGLPVDAHVVLEKLGLPVPDADAVLLGAHSDHAQAEANTVALNSAGDDDSDWVEIGTDTHDAIVRMAQECSTLEELQEQLDAYEGEDLNAHAVQQLALTLLQARVK